jgi:tocopherol O-methyltransferase
MTKKNTIVHNDIVNYYDNCQVDYSIVWHLKTHLSLHYGYWDTGINRLRQALVRMNDVLASKVQIRAADKVLDAGCGVGGAAIHLAQKFNCSVHGITLSEKQVAYATLKAEEKKMNQVKFSAADFTKMPFEDECFDVVWAVESVCHAHEKADFIKEAYRVLKKGGRLIVADFFRIMEKPNEDENYWLNNWGMSWAVPEFEYIKHFEQKAVKYGFQNVKVDNITANILPSAKRLYYCFIPGVICDGILRLIGQRNKTHKANVWSTYYQYQSLKRNLWNYNIVQAIKN